MAAQGQALNPTDAYWTLDPFARIRPNDAWFVDLEKLIPREHYGVTRRLQRNLGASARRPDFVHVGLMGHAGTGKTTLARNALVELSSQGLEPVFVDALQDFDQADFTFADIILVLAEAVFTHVQSRELVLEAAPLEAVRQWFAEELLTEAKRTQLFGHLETSSEVGISLPLVVKLVGKLTAALKTDSEYRREIRQRAQRDPRELLSRANRLLDAVHAILPRDKKLCIVFDNLEKTSIELVDKVLLQRAEEFRRLRTNTLLFFNPASEYTPQTIRASQAFECVSVPVLPVRFPGDAPDVVRPEAKQAIEHVLDRRLQLRAVFDEPEACIEALSRWSGGHIRDLLQLTRRAVENVEPDKVSVADIDHAGRWLGGRRTSSLRPEDLLRAVEIHRTHRILDTEQDHRMLKTSCVLHYNGTEWWDVHPAVLADDLFLDATRKLTEDA